MDARRIHRATGVDESAIRGMPMCTASASQRGHQRAHAPNSEGCIRPRWVQLSGADPCFAAYAAHELRGSIALQRTLAEVALADPGAEVAALREMGERVVAACERQERLLEALLTLAASECARLRQEPIDLAATVAEALRGHDRHGLRCTTALAPARTTGDPPLIERLVANLVANGVRHNIPGGRLDVATYTAAGRASFAIANTGPAIPNGELARLFEPFQRLSAHAGPAADGTGLGLAIVHAIANAHDATLTARARPGGGLAIDVHFSTEGGRDRSRRRPQRLADLHRTDVDDEDGTEIVEGSPSSV